LAAILPGTGWAPLPSPRLLFDLGAHLIDQASLLFGRALAVYAELDRRRPGAAADDDAFVALTHVSGVRSHLWMSKVAAQRGPRFRVLGERAAFTKFGLDVQEPALAAGGVPGTPGWGEEPPELWGRLGVDDATREVRSDAGCYQRFYGGLAAALRGAGPTPVDPEDAIATLEIIEAARSSAEAGVVKRLGR
jgi:predicted dehydrogenase